VRAQTRKKQTVLITWRAPTKNHRARIYAQAVLYLVWAMADLIPTVLAPRGWNAFEIYIHPRHSEKNKLDSYLIPKRKLKINKQVLKIISLFFSMLSNV
jgi:hypothetical protein